MVVVSNENFRKAKLEHKPMSDAIESILKCAFCDDITGQTSAAERLNN